ncbi:hypothetical protein TKK_0016923 [Trichogramma kaykai]|uniref:MOFRL-associated domain-containing protein n=1 Tax=Trichogramma kaykai TaxID=54128 RepID=A0ABD2W3X9_9HYME
MLQLRVRPLSRQAKFIHRHNLTHRQALLRSKNNLHTFTTSLVRQVATTSNSRMERHDDRCQLNQVRSELLMIFKAGLTAVMSHRLIESKITAGDDNNVLKIEDTQGKVHSCVLGDSVYLIGFGKAVAGMALPLKQRLARGFRRAVLSIPNGSLSSEAPIEITPELEDVKVNSQLILDNIKNVRRDATFEVYEGATNNQPDLASLEASKKILELVKRVEERSQIFVLISGGGSALLNSPRAPYVDFQTKINLCRKLQNLGADIRELNVVRGFLSSVKAGGLARVALRRHVSVHSLILSDIVGDPIESIASGPTSYVDLGQIRQGTIDILRKYGLFESCEESLRRSLLSNDSSSDVRDNVTKDEFQESVSNIVIGNNDIALSEAAERARREYGLEVIRLSRSVQGDVGRVSEAYAKFTTIVCRVLKGAYDNVGDFMGDALEQRFDVLGVNEDILARTFERLNAPSIDHSGVLLLAGGEPTVALKGTGKGGRNQELALRFSLDLAEALANDPELEKKYFILFLSAATDGQDGPTDAAGAFGWTDLPRQMHRMVRDLQNSIASNSDSTKSNILKEKLKILIDYLPESVLNSNDSYNFYKRFHNGHYLVKSGLTGTNVMDLHFIYIKNRNCDLEENHLPFQTTSYNSFLFEEP